MDDPLNPSAGLPSNPPAPRKAAQTQMLTDANRDDMNVDVASGSATSEASDNAEPDEKDCSADVPKPNVTSLPSEPTTQRMKWKATNDRNDSRTVRQNKGRSRIQANHAVQEI